MDRKLTESELITTYARYLKLPVLKENLEDILTEAVQGSWSHRDLINMTGQSYLVKETQKLFKKL